MSRQLYPCSDVSAISLRDRIGQLEIEVARLRAEVHELRRVLLANGGFSEAPATSATAARPEKGMRRRIP